MDPRRRILHLIGRLDGYGGARTVRHIAAAQAQAGAEVIVAALSTADGAAAELRERGVVVHILGSRWPIDPLMHGRLARLRAALRPAIVHVWDLAVLPPATLPRRTPGQGLVVTLDARQTGRRWSRALMRWLANRVDAFAVADETAAGFLRACAVAPRRTVVIPPGVPSVAPAPLKRPAWRTALGLPADARVIAVAGPLVRRKNFDDAIWCFELVRVIHDRARLIVIGDGPDRHRLEAFADEVSEPGCVRFVGYRRDVSELFSHVDAYWQLDAPLAVPLALLEASAAGAAVVVSDTPAHREVVTSGQSGWLVPTGHRAETARATDELFENADRAQRFGAAAAALVAERWSLDAMVSAYERLYDLAVAPGTGG